MWKKFWGFLKKYKTDIIFLLVGAIIIIGVCIWGIWIFPKLISSVLVRGQWGDSFGVVTALFTGLAFIILIWTLHVQKDELKLQREEIKGQKETLQKQNFESSFFQLLGMHSAIVNSMVIRKGIDGEYFGRECFGYMLRRLRGVYMGAPKQSYEIFFLEFQPYVGHYFRHLYNVVKFVNDQKVFPQKFKQKKRYTNLIRAQLSSDELGLLFYNCLSDRGAKFKNLVEKYALLEDMRFKTLMDLEHKKLYDSSAYGESE